MHLHNTPIRNSPLHLANSPLYTSLQHSSSHSHFSALPQTPAPVIGSSRLPLAYPGVVNSPLHLNAGEIKGESRVQYVPYERKVIEYEPVQRIEYVPVERKVTEYEQRKRIEQVPVERKYTDYYAIEHITEYHPQVIPETKIDYVPVERVENRVQYYPVERQIPHYPTQMTSYSRAGHFNSSVHRTQPIPSRVGNNGYTFSSHLEPAVKSVYQAASTPFVGRGADSYLSGIRAGYRRV